MADVLAKQSDAIEAFLPSMQLSVTTKTQRLHNSLIGLFELSRTSVFGITLHYTWAISHPSEFRLHAPIFFLHTSAYFLNNTDLSNNRSCALYFSFI